MLQLRDVGFIVLCDVRDCGPSLPQVFGGLPPYTTDRHALDLSPLGEIWQLRLSKLGSARRLCGCCSGSQQRLRMRLYVAFTDAAARSASFHVVNVYPDF